MRESGIQVSGTIFNTSVQLLSYATDIDLVGRSYAAVSNTFLPLDGAARRIGLVVNEAKTKYICTQLHQDETQGGRVMIGIHVFDCVDAFTYL